MFHGHAEDGDRFCVPSFCSWKTCRVPSSSWRTWDLWSTVLLRKVTGSMFYHTNQEGEGFCAIVLLRMETGSEFNRPAEEGDRFHVSSDSMFLCPTQDVDRFYDPLLFWGWRQALCSIVTLVMYTGSKFHHPAQKGVGSVISNIECRNICNKSHPPSKDVNSRNTLNKFYSFCPLYICTIKSIEGESSKIWFVQVI